MSTINRLQGGLAMKSDGPHAARLQDSTSEEIER